MATILNKSILDKIFVEIYTDNMRQCIGAGDLKFISKSSKVWRKEKEGSRWKFCFNGIELPIWLSEENLIFHWISDYHIDTEYSRATVIRWYDFDEKYDVYCVHHNYYKGWNYETSEPLYIYSFNFWIKVRRFATKDIIDVCRITDIYKEDKLQEYDIGADITISLRDGSVRF